MFGAVKVLALLAYSAVSIDAVSIPAVLRSALLCRAVVDHAVSIGHRPIFLFIPTPGPSSCLKCKLFFIRAPSPIQYPTDHTN